jgi:exodeoxyribonuclease VII large subunit
MQEIQTVSELTQQIKKHLEAKFPALLVKGEISNFKHQTSGHLYFTLKDAGAQISAVLFKGNTFGLSRLPKDGDQVIVKGELSLYAPRGNYQLIIRELQFAGLGELLLKLHALKEKVTLLGWTAPEKKKPLPKFPRTIGVVTSPTGSVIQDILTILTRRFRGFHLILNPVKVQGEGAAEEIASAIDQFNAHKLADVLIVGRGGGSLEDLWPFNEERVAEAIFRSEIPIISAVGHETDTCIADLVADLRAPTPSAAAELAMGEKAQHLQFLSQTQQRIKTHVLQTVKQHRYRLQSYARQPILSSVPHLLAKYHQQRDEMAMHLIQYMQKLIAQRKMSLIGLHKQAVALKPTTQIAHRKQTLKQLQAHLSAIDPRNLLRKGYALLYDEKEGSVILSTKQLKPQQGVRLQLGDGKAVASITQVDP